MQAAITNLTPSLIQNHTLFLWAYVVPAWALQGLAMWETVGPCSGASETPCDYTAPARLNRPILAAPIRLRQQVCLEFSAACLHHTWSSSGVKSHQADSCGEFFGCRSTFSVHLEFVVSDAAWGAFSMERFAEPGPHAVITSLRWMFCPRQQKLNIALLAKVNKLTELMEPPARMCKSLRTISMWNLYSAAAVQALNGKLEGSSACASQMFMPNSR